MRCFLAALAVSLLLLAAGCGQREDASEPAGSSQARSEPSSTTEAAEPQDTPAATAATATQASPGEEATSGPEAEPAILTLTVPEGYTLARIGMLLEEKGVCTVDDFIAATQNGDFGDYQLVAAQAPDDNRCFRLEGYLFPDTYEIYSTDSPEQIIRKMLDHLEKKVDTDMRARIDTSGYTPDQILTIASIIEKEAFGHDQMPAISSVLHNRLGVPMKLQCDVTITYVEGAIKPFITGDVNRFNDYYNTYKCAALPAGPICNPGMDAIKAALAPAVTDYLFFVTDANQNYYYAETWEQHQENVAKAGIGTQEATTD